MKLISCYIENFGKLSQYSYEFKNGLNVIEAENGWGKTTFAAFLKAMLFGMEYRIGKKILTDRDRYLPWQGGRYGGNLIVEINEKTYRIERYFGKKESDDTFIAYDIATNMETRELGKDFGEECWSVDRDSYEKSAFISLNDMGLLNDIISGKLGNIDEQEADMEASSEAIELLNVEMKKYKSIKRTSGQIYKKKAENIDLEIETKNCEKSIDFINQNEKWLQLEKNKIKVLDQEMKEIDDEQGMLLIYQKKKRFIEINLQLKELKEDYDQETSFFKDREMSIQELDKLEKEIKQYEKLKVKEKIPEPIFEEDIVKLKTYAKRFDEVISSEDKIDHYIKGYRVYGNLEDKEKILQEELLEIENEEKQETEKPVGRWIRIFMYIVGIMMIGMGVLFLRENMRALGYLGTVLGSFLIFWEVISAIKGLSNKKRERKVLLTKKEKKLEEIQEVGAKKEKIQSSCITFLSQLGVEVPTDIMKALLSIKVEYTMYIQLKENINLSQERQKQSQQLIIDNMRESKENIDKVFEHYYKNVPSEYSEALDIIKRKRIICKEKYKQYGTLLKVYRQFCEENDLDIIKKAVIPEESSEVLLANYRKRRNEITLEKGEIDKKIASYMHDINLAQIDVDKLLELTSRLEQNINEIEEMEENYRLLSIAKKCMEEAKENLAEKYMLEMTTAFKKYLGLLGMVDTTSYCIDAQLNIQIEQNGSRYESRLLSRGKQDLVQICMRMALVDAIYKDVTSPILILDDPFVNLDDTSIRYGLEMLHNISREYQMVYFVCHSSRRRVGKKENGKNNYVGDRKCCSNEVL